MSSFSPTLLGRGSRGAYRLLQLARHTLLTKSLTSSYGPLPDYRRDGDADEISGCACEVALLKSSAAGITAMSHQSLRNLP